MNNKVVLESLSMDLKRVALGYFRGSDTMAKRFLEEAIKRKNEIDHESVKPYIKRLLDTMESQLRQKDKSAIAEDSLLLSILLQNYVQRFLSKR